MAIIQNAQTGFDEIDLNDNADLKQAIVDWEQEKRQIEVAKETDGYLAFKSASDKRDDAKDRIHALIGDQIPNGENGRCGPYLIASTWNESKTVGPYPTKAKYSQKISHDAEDE